MHKRRAFLCLPNKRRWDRTRIQLNSNSKLFWIQILPDLIHIHSHPKESRTRGIGCWKNHGNSYLLSHKQDPFIRWLARVDKDELGFQIQILLNLNRNQLIPINCRWQPEVFAGVFLMHKLALCNENWHVEEMWAEGSSPTSLDS